MLRDGSVDSRSAAAEKLFNKAAEDETARTRTASLGVVQPLVRTLGILLCSKLPCVALGSKSAQTAERTINGLRHDLPQNGHAHAVLWCW